MQTRNKVLIGVLVLIGASWLAMSGSSGADPYLDVHTITDDPTARVDAEVSVKGEVVENTTRIDGTVIRFVLTDGSGKTDHAGKTIDVVYHGFLPDAFGAGKMAVVSGVLRQGPDGLHIAADNLQVGCSSKY